MLLNRSLLTAAALSFALAAPAQNGAPQPVPDAPLPSAPSSARPSFTVPAQDYAVPKSHASQLPDNTFCHADADGLFLKPNQHWPISMQGVMNAYIRNAMTMVDNQWSHHMSLGERNAWATDKHLALRFAIFPDGTHSAPEVTVSSRHPNDDEHAIAAVKDVGRFDPLPTGITHPVPLCITFGYNPKSWEQGPPDPLLKPPINR